MKLEVAKGIVNKIFEMAIKYKSKNIIVKYAGGEPLYMLESLLEIDKYVKELSEKHSIAYQGYILTNGTMLIVDTIIAIKEANIALTISIDGMGEYNKQRLYKTRKETFEDVKRNIELSIANKLYPNINIVVGEYNIEGLPDFTHWLLDNKLQFAFNLVRNHQYSKESIIFEEEKIINGLLKAFEIIKSNLPDYPLISHIADKMNPNFAHNYTCGAGNNYLVFNPKGEISKCHMELNKTVSSYLNSDPIADIREDRIFVRSYDIETIDECKECEIRYFCTAGCPVETYQKTGQYNKKSPNCNIYKGIFDELLILEALRMMK